ncbi:MAG: T9SS type A sorting domain-containing protein [Fidelibacterota bacterium]|nr:MAG: T9SS type A sorting domain-containing protein [Candidatus Neomarinimicrobiota bacterium]
MKSKLLGITALCLLSTSVVWSQVTHSLDPGTNVISAKLDAGDVYAGDILELAAGTFIEEDTVRIPIDLTIRGAAGAVAKWYVADSIDAIYAAGDLTLENIILETDTTTAWTFEVDTLDETSNFNVAIQGRTDGINIKVDHCQFIGFGWGIAADGDWPLSEVALDSVVVTNTLFYGGPRFKTEKAILMDYGYVQTLIVQNCTFWRVEAECIKVYGSDVSGQEEYLHALVENNSFVDIGYPGLEQYGIHFKYDPTKNPVGMYLKYTSNDDTLRNNIFYDIADFSIKMSSGLFEQTYMDYNTSDSSGWGCGTCRDWHGNHGDLGQFNIEGNGILLLADPANGDFTLETGSMAIGNASDGGNRGSSITVWRPGSWDHSPLSVEESPLPSGFALAQNYPNPFNPTTRIDYTVTENGLVTLDIYNILGQKVRTLVDGLLNPGSYTMIWDGSDDHGSLVAGGVYFYRLQAGTSVETRKMVLLK